MNNQDISARCITKTIRGIELDLYREARTQALIEGVTIGQWINQAIRERLAKTDFNKLEERPANYGKLK